MRTLIRNCRVISPGIDLPGASIEIEGSTVAAVHASGGALPAADRTFDADGRMALPGFVDIHCHGADGCDFTDATPEAVERIARAKLADGVTTLLATTLTLPEERLASALRAVAAYRAKQPFARIPGVHLEGPFIHPDCTGAQNPAFVRAPDAEEVFRLHGIAPVALVTCAVEVDGALDLVRRLTAAGIVVSCGHSAATFAQFRAAREAGARHLTHFCNQMSKLHHREVGLVGAGFLDDDVLVELICDRVHLCGEMIALAFKVKPRERIALVTDSISATGLGDGEFELGGLPVHVRGGEARLASTGALAGSVLRYPDALRNVEAITGFPLADLVRTTSLNQAESLGLGKIGRIEKGWTADVVVLDDAFRVGAVFVAGVRKI